MKSKTYAYAITALSAAIIAVLAQLSIPIPPVPITGQTLAIGLVVTILGTRYGTLSVILYILLGAIGIPVFAGFSGGLSVLVGPTGGYIIGFVPTALIIGLYLNKFGVSFPQAIVANIIGMVITLAFGTTWLKFAADMSWTAAFLGGVYPFIIVGIIKAVAAAWCGVLIRKRLLSAQLLHKLA